MCRSRVLLLAGLFLNPVSAQAQTPFDVQAYGSFLETHRNLDYPAFLDTYPAGTFLREILAVPADPAYFGTIDSFYLLTDYERSLLQKHGFFVSSRLERRTFLQAFHEIYVRDLPVFVSTDALLYAVHLSYDELLKALERRLLMPKLISVLTSLHAHVPALAGAYASHPGMSQSLRDVDLYLTLPLQLLGRPAQPHFTENAGKLDTLRQGIADLGPAQISLFGTQERFFDFSQFTVRGHYARDPELASYFRAMIWLGRTELYLKAPQGTIPAIPEADVQRQCIDAMLLREAVHASGKDADLADVDRLLTFLLGEADNVTVDQLGELARKIDLASTSELLDVSRLREFQDSLAAQPYAGQRIISQILIKDPLFPDRVQPASAFLLMGQRFIIDGFITGNVVYDKILYNGAEVRRMLPSSLDVLFALGNDAAGQLLQPELEEYHYASNLSGLRYLIDSYDESFWSSSVFCSWLAMIRALNPPLSRDALPPFMRTAAWWQEKMNTQLASWAQLRHDNILYGKQPYTVGIVCSYPESYVEPNVQFYDRLGMFARTAAGAFSDLPEAGGYFGVLAGVADTLSSIARKELDDAPLTEAEKGFLKGMLRTYGLCGTRYDGWYPQLLFGQEFLVGANDSTADYVVADIHTAPTDATGGMIGWVQHAGTGPVELAMVVASMPGGAPTAFIGPVQVYYEHLTTGFKRITDEEWETLSRLAPTLRPDWVNLYLANERGESRGEGAQLVTSVSPADREAIPASMTLHQNFPNPFNAATVIPFSVHGTGSEQRVVLDVFDVTGRKVATLLDAQLRPGSYTIVWDGTARRDQPLSSGVYLARMRMGGQALTKSMVMIR